MPSVPYTLGLHQVGPGCYAYLQPPGSWGWSNTGLVVSGGEALLVDTAWTLDLTRRMLDTIAQTLPDIVITTVVNTHPNGDHCWGNQLLAGTRIIASAATAHGMPAEIGPQAMTAMQLATGADTPLGRYMRRYFTEFDFTGISLVQPTDTFTDRTSHSVGGRTVELVRVGPAHTDGDTIVDVPEAGVLYAGDILFVGDHPVMWSGPIEGWITACDDIIHSGASVIVPGHGPVTDPAGVAVFRGYLQRVAEAAEHSFAQGMSYVEAAERVAAAEAHLGWGHPERLAVTLGGIYRQLGVADPPQRLDLIEAMAALAERIGPDEPDLAGATAET